MSKLKKGLTHLGRYHLLLAEAQGRGIHYGKLSNFASMYPGMRVLTNYYRGFQCICRKAMMVQVCLHVSSCTCRLWRKQIPPPYSSLTPSLPPYLHCTRQTLRDYYVNTLKNEDTSTWFIPETFALYPARREECEREALFTRVEAAEATTPGQNYWILKPSDGLKGNRIVVVNGLRDVKAHCESLSDDSVAWVASRYLHNPALVVGRRKFDVRCWVLLDKDYNMYMHKEGVLRTAASAYSLDDLSDTFTHLSNHCIAEKHPDFGKYEPTNELWFGQYDAYLRETSKGALGFYEHYLPQIKNVVAHTLEAGRAAMCPDPSMQNFDAFELFGFDIAITDDHKVPLDMNHLQYLPLHPPSL